MRRAHRSRPLGPMAILTIASLLLLGCGKSADEGTTTTSKAGKASSSSTSATSAPATSPSSAPATTTQPDEAVWPFTSTATRYGDPVDAARGFAVDYLGFVDPIIGEFQQGDSRSGEVAVIPRELGPVTTVMVRQLGSDDTWWVIGAATSNIRIDTPKALETVSSPVSVSGQSTAFEATINLEIREDGRTEPLAEGFTNGGSMGEMGPFSTSLTLSEGGAGAGAVIVKTISPKDGNIAEASVVRVKFGS